MHMFFAKLHFCLLACWNECWLVALTCIQALAEALAAVASEKEGMIKDLQRQLSEAGFFFKDQKYTLLLAVA